MNFDVWIRQKLPTVSLSSVAAVLKLAEEGATVPFMARYRKEATGNLDEVAIRDVMDSKEMWDNIVKRQAFISEEIQKQGKLDEALKKLIANTFDLDKLEDIYLPYKLKRKTKAVIAKEAGLEPLALWIWEEARKPSAGANLELKAKEFLNPDKKINDLSAALQGASDIIIEKLSETAELRQFVRDTYFSKGFIQSAKGAKAQTPSKYDKYFSYSEAVSSLLKPESSHRYLAMRRGWMEEELVLNIVGGVGAEDSLEKYILERFESEACPVKTSVGADLLIKAAKMAYKVYVAPSISNEVHKSLKEKSDIEAIKVFSNNVKQVLLGAPLGSKSVLGVDPGIRTGCKFAVVDAAGKYLHNGVFYLQTEAQQEQTKAGLPALLDHFKVAAIAVGNGTAGRETEIFIKKAIKGTRHEKIPVIMVNESGASIYSASDVARKEFPELDITVRGAISIARRLQDPLAELVKIDPKSIGVGQYQHDVSQPALKKALEEVVDSCVNQVGVNLNTASEYLLARVSGIGPALAQNILKYRQEKGVFKSRKSLLEVPRFTDKVFEQAAGFLRVFESENPLDKTGVHPENYSLLEDQAKVLGLKIHDLLGPEGVKKLAANSELGKKVGQFTLKDILQELEKPGRDPRESFEAVNFREDIFEVKDLTVNMICPGVVTNVTNFGAFVDIGVHQDGLVHISQLSEGFVKDPRDVVQPGQRVTVRVLEVNLDKNQIALSMRLDASAATSNSRSGFQSRDSGRGNAAASSRPAPRKDNSAPFNDAFAKLAKLKQN